MKHKLVKIYDVDVDEKKGVINSAKVKEICDLNKINKPYILNKLKKFNVCLPNFGGYREKTDEEGNDYWNILVWCLDDNNHYVSAVKSIYEMGEEGEDAEIVFDGCEHDIRVNSIMAAVSNGYITSKEEFEKLLKSNYLW